MSFLLLPSFFQTRPTQHTSPSGSEPAAFLRPHVQEPLWRRRPTAPALYTRHRDRDTLVGGAIRWGRGTREGPSARGRDHVPTAAWERVQVASGCRRWALQPAVSTRSGVRAPAGRTDGWAGSWAGKGVAAAAGGEGRGSARTRSPRKVARPRRNPVTRRAP